jgi:hypothetical protein
MPSLEGTVNEQVYKGAMLFFLAKAFKSYQAIFELCRIGFFQDAVVLSRSIFEIFLQACWMLGDPEARATAFAKHDPVERYNRYQKLAKFPSLVKEIEERQEELDQLRSWYDEFQDEFKRNKGWWGEDIRWLARQLGQEEGYLRLYPLYSPLVHSTSSSAKYYIEETDQGTKVDCGPSTNGQELAPFEVSTGFVLLTASATAKAWNLDREAASLELAARDYSSTPSA